MTFGPMLPLMQSETVFHGRKGCKADGSEAAGQHKYDNFDTVACIQYKNRHIFGFDDMYIVQGNIKSHTL